MQEKNQTEQINEIIDRLIGPQNALAKPSLLADFLPRLDVSRPNIHESKSEFLREKNAVETIIEHLEGIFDQVLGNEDDADHEEMVNRLSAAINVSATNSMRAEQVDSASDLILRNVVQAGFFRNSLLVVMEMNVFYNERLRELKDQEKQFWTVSHRPPNYYARMIALRLARLYAKETRQKPTFGIARDGNHPSTDFGRALEEIYSILGIKGSVRSAAVWAIDQLTEDDVSPPVNALAAGLFGFETHPASIESSRSNRAAIVSALKKGR